MQAIDKSKTELERLAQEVETERKKLQEAKTRQAAEI